MMSFLFWNVMRKDLRSIIARAVIERNVDVLLIAESGVSDQETVETLKEKTSHDYVALSEFQDKVRVFAKFKVDCWTRRTEASDARWTIWSLNVGLSPSIVLASVHLASKSHSSSVEQALSVSELAKEIQCVEDLVKHQRTLIIGDFNMNPFEEGMTSARALHAVMTKQIVRKRSRKVEGIPRYFFYNPMWGFFGDRTSGPAGTYYHRSPRQADLFWHMFDQVLLRPDLMDCLYDLAILDKIGNESLLTSSAELPRVSAYSDHLPLAFYLKLD